MEEAVEALQEGAGGTRQGGGELEGRHAELVRRVGAGESFLALADGSDEEKLNKWRAHLVRRENLAWMWCQLLLFTN